MSISSLLLFLYTRAYSLPLSHLYNLHTIILSIRLLFDNPN